jgi:uncharacterized ubiquitin-like protein YukD
MDNRIVIQVYLHKQNQQLEIEIPLDISANELIIGLNEGLSLGLDTSDLSLCHLKCENPVAFLAGNRLLSDYGLHNGTIINIQEA